VIRVHEEVRHRESVVAKGPRCRETDEAIPHLGHQHDVVFSWRLENRQLRMLKKKFPIPFVSQNRTTEDPGHGGEIVKRAGAQEHRHIVAQQTVPAADALCSPERFRIRSSGSRPS
jgi:hypothetical protein